MIRATIVKQKVWCSAPTQFRLFPSDFISICEIPRKNVDNTSSEPHFTAVEHSIPYVLKIFLVNLCSSLAGSYSDSAGLLHVQRSVAVRRDAGVPSHSQNIFISAGSQQALTVRPSRDVSQWKHNALTQLHMQTFNHFLSSMLTVAPVTFLQD